jgi:predicted nucleic acid-binding protein
MCVIIDTNVFPMVFSEKAKGHARFAPVLKWITTGNGKMVLGGEKYARELRGSGFTKILAELSRRQRIVLVSNEAVDHYAAQLKIRVPDEDFDDEHIVALVAISRCCVICSDDKRSFPYVRRRDLYPKGVKPPKIFRYASHEKKLCCEKHIVPICR